MRGRLYLLFLSSMAVGIVTGRFAGRLAVVVVLLTLLSASAISIIRFHRHALTIVLPAAFLVLGLLLSVLTLASEQSGLLPGLALKSAGVELEGAVASTPLDSGGRLSFFFKAARARLGNKLWSVSEKVFVTIEGGKRDPSLFPGARLRMRGKLRPGGKSISWLLERGAAAAFSVEAGSVEAAGRVGIISSWIAGARGWLCSSFRRLFDPSCRAFIEGVVLSKIDEIEPGVLADLKQSGLLHVVSVSGLHVGSAAMLVLAIGAFLRIGRGKRYALACLTAVVVLGLADFRPCATRAVLMAALCFGGAVIGRRYDSLAGLCIAGFLILVMNPLALFDMGFQYSFAAAAGIVILMRRRDGIAGGRFRLFIGVCAAAQLGILPLALLRGEVVPVTAVIANLLAVPLVGVILLTSILSTLLLAILPPAGKLLAMLPGVLARFVLQTASFFSRVPGAGVALGIAGLAALALYVAGLVMIVRRGAVGQSRSFFKPAVALCAAMLLVMLPRVVPLKPGGGVSVTMLDVGQGDATLFVDACGSTVLFDGGPEPELLMRKLEKRGITRLDLVVVSHPHADHYGGLADALGRLNVGWVIEPGVEVGGGYEELEKTIAQRRIPCAAAREGQRVIVSPETSIDILYTPRDLIDEPANLNDASVVAMVHCSGISVLMSGDIEETGQETLLALHPDLDCDVLKVPHQGARNAATRELFEACEPSVATISVEKGNKYGHPSAECLSLLAERGVRVFRTDMSGDIEISSVNDRIGVKTRQR